MKIVLEDGVIILAWHMTVVNAMIQLFQKMIALTVDFAKEMSNVDREENVQQAIGVPCLDESIT